MALTENNYVGNGSTVLYSFTFPYLATTDIKVSLDGVVTTSYTLANATTVQFNAAPTNGTKIRIYRETADGSLSSTFYPGSSIRSQDLNNNFTQNLYVTQEARNTAASATSTANSAVTTSNTALSQSAAAVSTANTASSNATAAVNTSNSASAAAASAVSTANTASANSTTAINTANSAVATANTKGDAAIASAATANTTAASAVSTANAATATANNAVSIANTKGDSAIASAATANNTAGNALTAANNAVNIANTKGDAAIASAATANTTAASAVSTANSAVTTASSAAATATTANNKADQAIAAVSNSINYQLKANVAAIPASPANDTYIEVQDSTGLESFTPLAGKPAGFVGDAGLSVRLRYTSAGTTWNWLNYYANNSDSRYLKLAGGTVSGNVAVTGTLTKGGNNVVTVGDTGTVTSAMVADGTLVDADINAAAAIAKTKISGTAITAADTGTVTSTMIADGTIVNADINAAAAIDKTKISGTAITAADTGTVTSTMIADGTILNADVNAAAAIAGTKISPDFGSQNVTTTGTVTGASLSPSSSTAPTNGVYLPAANTVGISTNGVGRLSVSSTGDLTLGTSTAGGTFYVLSNSGGYNGPAIVGQPGGASAWQVGTSANFVGDGSTDLALQAGTSKNIRLYTNGSSERVRITSAGLVGIGTSSPGSNLDVRGSSTGTLNLQGGSAYAQLTLTDGGSGTNYIDSTNTNLSIRTNNSSWLRLGTNNTTAVHIDSSQRVGIGVTSPAAPLDLSGDVIVRGANSTIRFKDSGNTTQYLAIYGNSTDANINAGVNNLVFYSAATERARFDGSGRLLVGTSSSTNVASVDSALQIVGTGVDAFASLIRYGSSATNNLAPGLLLARSGSSTKGTNTIVANNNALGFLHFAGANGSGFDIAATITAEVDATPGASNDMPGRLVFSTTADGASSPTERLRIANNGAWGLAGANYGSSGQVLTSNGSGSAPTWSTSGGAGTLQAWVNFNGTGTVAIRASGNVSSITDNGTGDYTVNFTTAMPDANYAIAGAGQLDTTTNDSNFILCNIARTASNPATGSLRLTTLANGPNKTDATVVAVAIFR